MITLLCLIYTDHVIHVVLVGQAAALTPAAAAVADAGETGLPLTTKPLPASHYDQHDQHYRFNRNSVNAAFETSYAACAPKIPHDVIPRFLPLVYSVCQRC